MNETYGSKAQILKMIEGRIDTASNLLTECFELLYNAGYNDAVEAAAKIADDADELAAQWIRKLKK